MADNYLERRMEDLRSGRLAASSRVASPTGPRKGYLSMPFPMRRVLVVGDIRGLGRHIATAFVKAGCNTAVFDPDKAEGERLAHDHGVRFHCVDLSDPEEISKAMANLFKAWSDLDIIIICPALESMAPVISRSWSERRASLPYPNDFGGRLILLSASGISSTTEIRQTIAPHNISATQVSGCSLENADGIARLCIFLASPGADFITHVSSR